MVSPRHGVGALVLLALTLSACGAGVTSAAGAQRALTGQLPVSSHARPVSEGSAACSPDGGFYVDHSRIAFYYSRQVPLADILPLLSGPEARDARQLAGLGPLLEVVALARNPGASTCGVGLTQTVLETSAANGGTLHLVPAGARSQVQLSYYDPIRPILVLSSNRLDLCSADVNPGADVWLLAVFPPVRQGIPLALVNPAPQYGFFMPVGRGALPSRLPTDLYSEDVNHCLQILSAG